LLQRYVYTTQQFLIAYHDKKEMEPHRKRLLAYSQYFTYEAGESGDEELIKAAKECENFVRDHCQEKTKAKARGLWG